MPHCRRRTPFSPRFTGRARPKAVCWGRARASAAPPKVPFLTGGPLSSTMDGPAPGQGLFPLLRAAPPDQTNFWPEQQLLAGRQQGDPGQTHSLWSSHIACVCQMGTIMKNKLGATCRIFECEPRWQPQLEAN